MPTTMGNCIYDCVDGQALLFDDDCPHSNCPLNGGPCNVTNGELIIRPCPSP